MFGLPLVIWYMPNFSWVGTKWIFLPKYSVQIMKKYGRYDHLDDHSLLLKGVRGFPLTIVLKVVADMYCMIQLVHLSQKRRSVKLFLIKSHSNLLYFFSISNFTAMWPLLLRFIEKVVSISWQLKYYQVCSHLEQKHFGREMLFWGELLGAY